MTNKLQTPVISATWHIKAYNERMALLKKVKIVGPISQGESNGLTEADYNRKIDDYIFSSYNK